MLSRKFAGRKSLKMPCIPQNYGTRLVTSLGSKLAKTPKTRCGWLDRLFDRSEAKGQSISARSGRDRLQHSLFTYRTRVEDLLATFVTVCIFCRVRWPLRVPWRAQKRLSSTAAT